MWVYRKLDPNKNQISNGIILPMYKQALKLSIARKLHEKDPDDIEQAFKIAKRVERGKNFLKDEIEENPKKKQNKDEIEELIRKMEKLFINLIQANQRIEEGFNKWENFRRNITCYNCERVGHYASECTQSSSKLKYNPNFYCTNCNKQGHTKRYCTRRKTVNYLEENDSEGEIYLTTRSGKSYNMKNFNNFAKNKDKDDKEIKKKKIKDDDMEIDIRTTRGSSRLDKTRSYDIIKDLDDIKPNITFAQLIKESRRIEKELRDVMKRPTFKELKNLQEKNRKFKKKIRQKQDEINLLEYKEIKDINETINSLIEETLNEELNNIEEVELESENLTEESEEDNNWLENCYEITPLYGKFKIKSLEINVIIDTSASTNIITKTLLEKLNIKIEKPSSKIFTSANGKDIIALGKVKLNFEIQKKKLPIKLQVIESKEEKILIGMKWLKKVKAEINLENNTIKIIKWKTPITIPISCKRIKKRYENPATHMINLLFNKPLKKIRKEEITFNKELSKEEQQLNELLKEFEDIISTDEKPKLGRTGIIKYEIKVTENPIKERPYPVKDNKWEKWMKEEIEWMLKEGIIKKLKSPWASPVVLVSKKDESIRFCVDYKKTNAITIVDAHLLPVVNDIVDKIEGKKYYILIDLASGYWQVEVDKNSQDITAFVIPWGLYQFNVMSFGLTNVPATFQRLINYVLHNYLNNFIVVYLDDILVCSDTFEEYLDHLRKVFIKLWEANLVIKLKKCKFG